MGDFTHEQLIDALQVDNIHLRAQNHKLWECVDYANAEKVSDKECIQWAELPRIFFLNV